MKLGVPWSVKGIRPEARESAKEAARRAGVPLGDWLNSVIVNSAAQEGVDPDAIDLDEDQYGGEDIATVNAKLDSLTRRIDRLTRDSPEAYAPRHVRNADQRADLINRVDQRLDQFAHATHPAPSLAPSSPFGGLDRAVAEIAARQRALNGGPVAHQPGPSIAAPRAPVPTQDLSGLEEQLHRITAQIETLNRPGVEEAINALRGELAEIGQSVSEAMPRQAIDAIERQIQGLTHRVAEGRQAGVEHDVLAGLEHGIAEVRDALRTLTPAESLHGFQEAVDGLAHKIDSIVAQNDPATLQQLEHAIVTLRGISGHIASNETVGQLAEQVAALADKVDRIANASAAGDALANLEHRIATLSDALAERSQSGGAVPPGLEALVHSLTSKIEQLQSSRGDSVAVGHLEERIVKLVEKLDASDSRLGNLEVVERGLADLLLHMEEMRGQKSDGGLRAPAGVDTLKQDLARTQDALQAVNGTLAKVVDRLALIEHGSHANAPLVDAFEPLPQPVGKLAVRAVPQQAEQVPMPPSAAPIPPPAPPRFAPNAAPHQSLPPHTETPAANPARMQFRHIEPIDPDLPPDQPLEPGSGPPRRPHPGARIAASEADLGDANPAAVPPRSKSSFLAAARRAAKAAVDLAPKAAPREESKTSADSAHGSVRGRIAQKVKSLFVSASVIAIVIGGLQIGSTYFDFGTDKSNTRQLGLAGDAKVARDAGGKAEITASIMPGPETQPERQASRLPGMIPPATKFGIPSTAATPIIPDLPTTAFSSVPRLTGVSPATPSADITGSVSRGGRQPVRTIAPSAPGKLPNEIGGATLRQAATEGEAGAAYEVAIRFAEGRGVPANIEEAARWFERAARDGLAPAQFRLGSLYEKGQGVKKDLGRARQLYGSAAAKGNAKAMHNLAVLYAEGIEGKPDYALAAQWFRKAAARGVPDSQYNLGILCARGLGTEKSLAESYKWFALAADSGDTESARKRDEVAARLDPKGLAAAEQAVKAFKPEPQPPAAINVPAPDGGWDNAADSGAPARGKPKAPGAFEVGAR